jgi:hypothetical protein
MAGPYDDTWQVPGHVAASGSDTCFGVLGVRLDQSRGDTSPLEG